MCEAEKCPTLLTTSMPDKDPRCQQQLHCASLARPGAPHCGAASTATGCDSKLWVLQEDKAEEAEADEAPAKKPAAKPKVHPLSDSAAARAQPDAAGQVAS